MANRIPQQFFSDLLNRIDIVDVIDGYIPLSRSGKTFKALCPFHDEKTPSFTVSQDKQFYHCFGCNASGTAIGFLMDYSGMEFLAAVETLAAQAGLKIPREAVTGTTTQPTDFSDLYALMEQATQYFREQLREHPKAGYVRDYIKQRGISDELVEEFELGFAPPGWDNLLRTLGKSLTLTKHLQDAGLIASKDGKHYDRFRNRLIFPIRNQREQVIAFGGRAFGDDTPKYLNSPETAIFSKGRELYGLHQLRRQLRSIERLYVVEGYMDVLALVQHGVKNTVAALGTAITQNHLHRLFRNKCTQLVFAFDGDIAGKKATWRTMKAALPLLKDGRQIYFMLIPAGEDPDSFIRQHGSEEFEKPDRCIPLSDYLISTLQQHNALSDREAIGKFIDDIVPLIAQLPQSGLRELLINDVAKLTKIAPNNLQTLIQGKRKPAYKIHAKQRISTSKIAKLADTKVSDGISLLLQHPWLGECVEANVLDEVNTREANFLGDLLALVQNQSGINCAVILEYYRDTKYYQRLSELAVKKNLLSRNEEIKNKFIGIIEKIQTVYQKQQRDKKRKSNYSMDDLRREFSQSTQKEKND